MEPSPALEAFRVRRFDREFKNTSRREHWLTLYLSLREAGDDHQVAVETIREQQNKTLCGHLNK